MVGATHPNRMCARFHARFQRCFTHWHPNKGKYWHVKEAAELEVNIYYIMQCTTCCSVLPYKWNHSVWNTLFVLNVLCSQNVLILQDFLLEWYLWNEASKETSKLKQRSAIPKPVEQENKEIQSILVIIVAKLRIQDEKTYMSVLAMGRRRAVRYIGCLTIANGPSSTSLCLSLASNGPNDPYR